MFLEMGHGFARRFEPLTVCSYDVDVDGTVDLTTAASRAAAGVELPDMSCAWAYDLVRGQTPASWVIARRLIAEGAAGILTPSFARGTRDDMTNLVLWRWGMTPPQQAIVHDPSGHLPRDPSSWQ